MDQINDPRLKKTSTGQGAAQGGSLASWRGKLIPKFMEVTYRILLYMHSRVSQVSILHICRKTADKDSGRDDHMTCTPLNIVKFRQSVCRSAQTLSQ